MTIEILMQREVRTCRPEDSLAQAAHTLWESDCGALPVLDGRGAVIGMLTDRDICMAGLFQGKPPAEIPVNDVMTGEVYSLRAETSLRDALAWMRERQVRRLPVVDEEGLLLGLLTLADLARAWDRRAQVDGQALAAADVARTLADITRPRTPAPQAMMVVEITPRPRPEPLAKAPSAKKKRKRAAKKKPARKSRAKAAGGPAPKP